jgi:hypothetical protein
MKIKIRSLLIILLAAGLGMACEEDLLDQNPAEHRVNYLGVWNVTESTGINHPQFYTVDISEGVDPDEIVINGLYNESASQVRAVIDGNQLSIPLQNSANISFQGSGQANADYSLISLSFTADDGAGPDNIEATLRP